MTNVVDLPAAGPANWTNYVDYWREEDAEWLQSRTVLRVDTPAQLGSLITAPTPGQVVYVKDVAAAQKDVLFLYASNTGAGSPGWVPYPALPKYLYASEDSTARVTIGHHAGDPANVVPAVTMSPTGVDIPANLSVRTDKFKVTAADIQIKTGTKNVILTTDAAGLVSDSPIKAPGITVTGPITATGQAITAASVTAGVLTSTGAVNAVSVAASAGITAASVTAPTHNAGTGAFTGDANGAYFRGGGSQVAVHSDIWLQAAANINVDSQLRVFDSRSILWYSGDGAGLLGYSGPVIYSGGDPGAGNYPNGTIWVS